MASEDHPSPSRYSQTHRLSQSDPRFLQPAMPDLEPSRSRGSSSARQDGYTSDSSRYSQRTRPINDAVNSAVNSTNAVDSGIPPELLERLTAQITANVVEKLKSTNLQSTSSPGSHAADNTSSTTGSPPMGRSAVYTPPSPHRLGEQYHRASVSRVHESSSVSDPTNAGESLFSQPSPNASFANDRYTPPPDASQSDHANDSDAKDGLPSRPKPPQRVSTTGDMTVVEKIWGKLFDSQGEPTPRLEQYLRGVAVHLIEDYEPKNSLVITPKKMQEYYNHTKISEEVYPWQVIFDDRTSSISRMLRELEVQHHLVQEKVSERPDTPGLTPQGFAVWATMLIKAHPQQEFERLAKTAVDMPISNPDDKKERFPKELTRRLLPKQGDQATASKLRKAMTVHCNVTFKVRTESSASVDPSSESTSYTATKLSQDDGGKVDPTSNNATSNNDFGSISQREQKSQSFSREPAVIDSEDENTVTPQPIERERKPYVAQPGGGKTFDTVTPNGMADGRSAGAAPDIKPPPAQDVKLGRSQSMRGSDHNRVRPVPISVHQPVGSTPIDIPESRHHRTSLYRREAPPTSGSAHAPRRNRSPSAGKDYPTSRRTLDAQDISSHYGQPHSATSVGSFESTGINSEPSRRYQDYESARRDRYAEDRYDAARMSAYDSRERDRDRERVDHRPRGQSVATAGLGVGIDHVRSAEEEYYRNSAGYPTGAGLTPVTSHNAAPSGRREERERERDREPAYSSSSTTYQAGMAPPPPAGINAPYPPSAYRDGR